MQHRCPICKKPTNSEVNTEFPFCSDRCRLHDLGNWASEKYVIPVPIEPEDEVLENESPKNESNEE